MIKIVFISCIVFLFSMLILEFISSPYEYEWLHEKEKFDKSTLSRKIANIFFYITWGIFDMFEEFIYPSERRKY